MKKFKFLLPMLAIVFAMALSFAFVNTSADAETYAIKFILVEEPDGWATIDVVCNPQQDDCTVEYTNDPLSREFIVYNTKNIDDKAVGDGQVITLNGSVPNPN